MANEHVCPCTESCPLQMVMNAIGGKWKMSILCSLSGGGPTRYNEIKRNMKGISNTMLSKSLKELEEDGLVKRTEYMEVPVRVEYETTGRVQTLLPILADLADWGSKNLPAAASDGD